MSNGPILIVEDDVDLQPLLSYTFQNDGSETRLFDNGTEAWDYLQTVSGDDQPTVLIIDLLMPEMGGIELLRRCSDDPNLSAIPAVVLTAIDSEDMVSEAFEAGADDYVTKPFSPHELRTRVNRLRKQK